MVEQAGGLLGRIQVSEQDGIRQAINFLSSERVK